MAGGKETPRQKMIGMMYLVLTAMLALNVSKDILNAFIIVNDGLEKTNANFMDKIDAQYAAFEVSYSENKSKVEPWYNKAMDVKKRANDLYDYMMRIKANIISQTEGYESLEAAMAKDQNGKDTTVNIKNIGKKDNYDILTNLLVGSEPGQPKTGELTANELRTKMESYRDALLGYVDPATGASLETSLKATFNFEDRKDASGVNNNWESYNFYHTPLAATLTILSKMQSDVRNAESDILKHLYANVDAGSIKFNVIDAAIIPQSNYVIQGDSFKAQVFLAAYDSTKKPTIEVGKNFDSTTLEVLDEDKLVLPVHGGKGRMAIKAGAEGDFTWKGVIKFRTDDGRDLKQPFTTTYTVARPSLVVSADKMNVFYKGVDNPVSVSVPGVPADKLSPSISNGSMSRGKDGYIVRVRGGNTATISVSASMPDGSKKSMGSMEFRVKTIPNPVPYVAGQTGSANVKQVVLENSSKVFAKMENFDFDLTPIVTGYVFSTTVSGGALVEEKVRGPNLTGSVKNLIKKSRKNSKVYFEKIAVKMPDGTTRELGPISLKLQ